MNISAKITGIKYTPFLCRELNAFGINDIDKALSKEATFILDIDERSRIAISWWLSPKRTRSYPYARVYDSLNFPGKKVTVIPVVKDEGKEGDRDFLQWDTVSLMSLLGVYAIVSYYSDATASSRYKNKITNQRFNIKHIKSEINKLLSYQSDALHWNLSQIDKVGQIGQEALKSYDKISTKLGISMHSVKSAGKRIKELLKGKNTFIALSRELAEKAQKRESVTRQPKEKLSGTKAILTIKNYLGGVYYFTCDEVKLSGQSICLSEGKYTRGKGLPSLLDVKDGLLKMVLFTNLEAVKVNSKTYTPVPILQLTVGKDFQIESLNKSQTEILNLLRKEAKINGFQILINK